MKWRSLARGAGSLKSCSEGDSVWTRTRTHARILGRSSHRRPQNSEQARLSLREHRPLRFLRSSFKIKYCLYTRRTLSRTPALHSTVRHREQCMPAPLLLSDTAWIQLSYLGPISNDGVGERVYMRRVDDRPDEYVHIYFNKIILIIYCHF